MTRAFRKRGVTQHGTPTALSWGQVQGKNGRERVGITTALHEREERALLAHARTAAADKTAALAPAQIAAAVARFPDLDYASGHGQAQRAVMNHDAHQISLALRERRRELGEVGANRMTSN